MAKDRRDEREERNEQKQIVIDVDGFSKRSS